MRNLKRALSLVMAAAMLIGMMVVSAGAVDYADQADIDYTEAVGVMSAIEVLEGNGKNFNPDGILTREQAAKIITYVVMGKTKAEKLAASTNFTDVKATDWAAKYIAYCAAKNIIAGDGTGKFNPKGELTGFAFGKMLLVALGFDPAACGLTGSAWEINTSTLLAAEKLDAGLENVVLSNPMTREQAAQMALNAMKWSTTPDTYNVVKGTAVVGTYATLAEATREAALLNALTNSSDYTTAKASATDTLLKTVFNVDAGTLTDDFGRPGNSYALNDAAGTVLKYAAAPVFTFNTAMKESDIFTAIGVAGIAGSEAKYIVMDKIYEDGKLSAESEQIGTSGQYQAKASGGINETVIVSNAATIYNAAGTGNGVNVEIYATDTANHYIMVAYHEYAGTVSGVTAANATTGAARYVTITLDQDAMGYGTIVTFNTDSFAFGDKVLVSLTVTNNAVKVQTAKAASAVSGTVTKITNGSVYTIGGVDYKLSQLHNINTTTNLVLGVPGSWYVDSCNNLIAVQTAAATPWSYGYLTGYQFQNYASNNLLGTSAKDNAEKFQIITSTGDKVVLDGAFTVNAATNAATFVGKDLKDESNTVFAETTNEFASGDECLVRYKLDANGKVAVIEQIVTTGTATGATASSALTATNGSAQLNSKYVTDSTVFFAIEDAAAGKFAVYTGYKNIPATLVGSAYEYFYATKVDGTDDATAIGAVMLKVASAAAQTNANLVYFATAGKSVESVVENGSTVTVTTFSNVYLNGVKGELKFSGTAPSYIVAGDLYKYVTDTKTGYATLVQEYDGVTAATADTDRAGRLGNAVEITNIQSGYFVANSAIEYVGTNTAYFQVDATTGAVTTATGLPALSAAYTVKVLYSNSTSSTVPASVVYFTVIPA